MITRQLIVNVNIIGPDSILENMNVVISGSRIEALFPQGRMAEFNLEEFYRVHDGKGAYLAPGFIDIHSDNIESLVQPRPTSMMDMNVALMEQEKQLVNHGITMMFHSLTFMSDNAKMIREKATRNPEKMKELTALIATYSQGEHLIRHRFHCRYDIRNVDGHDTLMGYLQDDLINLLSFTDHTPGQGQYRNLDQYRDTMRKYNPQMNETGIENLIRDKMSVPRLSHEKMEATASLALMKGIPIASHDDDSEEKLEYMQKELNVQISEFPVELTVARSAKARGMLTVAGAPNVMLGKSHSGNVSASEAILDGSIDILCSDYYPPAMLHAVFKLNTAFGYPLWKGMNLVSRNPALALGIAQDYGSVEEGKMADLVFIRMIGERPSVSKVFIAGELVSELNYRQAEYVNS